MTLQQDIELIDRVLNLIVGPGYCEQREAALEALNRLAAACEPQVVEDKHVSGDTSDGYHTFNELYEHRHALFIALLERYPDKAWKSWQHSDGSAIDGWFIAGIETPEGQATYHLPKRLWGATMAEFKHRAPEWDGHTSDDVLKRIGSMDNRADLVQPSSEADLDALKVPVSGMMPACTRVAEYNRGWNSALDAAQNLIKGKS